MFKISELKNVLKNAEFINIKDDIYISSVEHDTRRIKTGALYIAIRGDNLDGHDFILDAKLKGSVACICERKVDSVDFPQIIVKDSVVAYGELAKHWRTKFTCKVVALTGSNGKTTTKEILKSILSKKYKTYFTQGNFNNLIGVPYTILGIPLDSEFVVVELGMNSLGEIDTLSKIADPDIALITNIGRAHIGKLGSIEAVAKAKLELFEYVYKKNGSFCVNIDDEMVYKWVLNNKLKGYSGYSIKNRNADLFLELVSSNNEEQKFIASYKKTKESLNGSVKITGSYNLYNIAAAIAVGLMNGIELKTCVEGLSDFTAPKMRSNIFDKEGVYYLMDCYNANPDSMTASLKSFSNIKTNGKKIIVVGDMLELDGVEEQMHYEIGRLIASLNFDMTYVVGSYSKYYYEGFISMNKFNVKSYDINEKDLLKKELSAKVVKGDYVLLKASRGVKLEEVL